MFTDIRFLLDSQEDGALFAFYLGPTAADCIAVHRRFDGCDLKIRFLFAVCVMQSTVLYSTQVRAGNTKYIYEMHAPMDAGTSEMEERWDKNLFIVEIAFTLCSEWKRSSDCIRAIVHTQKLQKHFVPSENSETPKRCKIRYECTYCRNWMHSYICVKRLTFFLCDRKVFQYRHCRVLSQFHCVPRALHPFIRSRVRICIGRLLCSTFVLFIFRRILRGRPCHRSKNCALNQINIEQKMVVDVFLLHFQIHSECVRYLHSVEALHASMNIHSDLIETAKAFMLIFVNALYHIIRLFW